MSHDGTVIVEIFGEGKTDVGTERETAPPNEGVVPILLHRLCGRPPSLRVKRKRVEFLQGKGLWQKVHFAKRQAFYNRSAGAVFVVDSEGDLRERQQDLTRGRDFGLPEFPMAVGVAHPCVESWLLADGPAIRRALDLQITPQVPEQPEDLPAPRHDGTNNPKTVLCRLAGPRKKELSAGEKDRIAASMNDMHVVRARCPRSFAPFADEVERHIQPLF